jgi:hypothetical protein
MSKLTYYGTRAVCLYGASSGVIDLGGGGQLPTCCVPQLDLRSNATYKFGMLCSSASSNEVGDTFASACTGIAFTNQPNNDGIEVVSDTAGDVRTVTLYGTTTGTNIVVAETVTLNGASAVSASKTDWGYLLGAVASAVHATATITIREASGNATITTITGAAVTSSGITAVASGSEKCYDLPVAAVGSGATTKLVGVIGKDCMNNTIYDALTLSGTTSVIGRQGFRQVTHLLHGDLESTRTATFSVGNLSWQASSRKLTTLSTGDPGEQRPVELPFRYLHWSLSNGTSAATGGEHDWVSLELWG